MRILYLPILFSLGGSLALGACTVAPASPAAEDTRQQQERPGEALAATAAPLSTAAQSALARAERLVALAAKASDQVSQARQALTRAQIAAEQGHSVRTQRLAELAHSRAQAVVTGEYLRRSRRYAQRSERYTGLREPQMRVLRDAATAMARAEQSVGVQRDHWAQQAYRMYRAFDLATRQASSLYTVRPGDSLRRIAADPDVYGNANLWPLIYEANLDVMTDPEVLQPGWELRIRSHPRIQEVYAAIESARGYGSVTVGPVRPAHAAH